MGLALLHEPVLRQNLVDLLEEILELPGQDTALVFHFLALSCFGISHALDGEGLPRASLAVREDGSVVALEARVDHGFTDFGENFSLRLVLVSHKVESVLILFFSIKDHNFIVDDLSDAPPLGSTLLSLQDLVASSSHCVRGCQWSHPDYHLHILSFTSVLIV